MKWNSNRLLMLSSEQTMCHRNRWEGDSEWENTKSTVGSRNLHIAATRERVNTQGKGTWTCTGRTRPRTSTAMLDQPVTRGRLRNSSRCSLAWTLITRRNTTPRFPSMFKLEPDEFCRKRSACGGVRRSNRLAGRRPRWLWACSVPSLEP